MILTCPECESRFILSAQALAPEGRHVKCSNCGASWHQLPDPDELIAEIEENVARAQDADDGQPVDDIPDVEDIPDAVKPIPEDAPQNAKDEDEKNGCSKMPLVTALLVFLLLISPLFIFQSIVVNSWPESMVFYKSVGLLKTVPGEGLVFDQMQVERDGDAVLISGQIINLSANDTDVPMIEAALKDADHETTHRWYINPPRKHLKAEETMPFMAEYVLPEGGDVYDIQMRFALKKQAADHKAAVHSGEDDHKNEDVHEHGH